MLQPQSILRIVISHGTESLDTTIGESGKPREWQWAKCPGS